MYIKMALSMLTILGSINIGYAENTNPKFEIPKNVTFITGDSWLQGKTIVRLFGVQSCIRGTKMTIKDKEIDCGELSMEYLANFMLKHKVTCQGVTQTKEPPQYLAVCKADINGKEVDLGTAIILSGFAFASLDRNGDMLNLQYALAEEDAKKEREGLWGLGKFPHPNIVMNKALQKAQSNTK